MHSANCIDRDYFHMLTIIYAVFQCVFCLFKLLHRPSIALVFFCRRSICGWYVEWVFKINWHGPKNIAYALATTITIEYGQEEILLHGCRPTTEQEKEQAERRRDADAHKRNLGLLKILLYLGRIVGLKENSQCINQDPLIRVSETVSAHPVPKPDYNIYCHCPGARRRPIKETR